MKNYFEANRQNKAFDETLIKHVGKLLDEIKSRYISNENIQRLKHGGDWQHPANPNSFNGGIQQHSATLEIPFEDLLKNDLTAIDRFLEKFTSEMERQFAETFYSTLSKSCEQIGNVVDASAEISPEVAFEKILEKIVFVADKNENVSLPEIRCGTIAYQKLTALMENASPEYHERIEKLKTEKIQQARTHERERKSKFLNYGANP